MSKYLGRIITNQAPAGYSVFFDGSGDFLSVASNAAFGFGTGNFTVECWVYPSSFSANQTLVDARSSNSATPWLLGIGSTGLARTYDGSTARTGGQLTASVWNHVAWSRSGSTNNVYVNGVLGHTWSGSTDFDSSKGLTIGSGVGTTGELLTGYISNLRILKGTALYTAAFTPPTQLLNVTNTSLLTCNSPAIVDQSSNAFAITTNGNAAPSTFTPFAAYNPYTPALGASTPGVWTLDEAMQAAATRQWNMYDPSFQNTTLLLHGNGTNGAQNNTFLDSSSNNFTITRNGNTTQGSFSPFSQTGWSNYFGGSQSINAPASTDFQFSGDFTIEMWAYTPSTTDASIFVQQSSTNYFALNVTAGTNINVYLNNSSANFTVTDRVPATNTWNHIALVRSGSGSGNLKIYLNGVASATTATNTSTLGFNALFYIGALGTQSGGSFNGYISNLRVVAGTALYTSNFTPSTTPLTAVTNTKLLTCQSNRFIDTNTQVTAKTITVNGTPSVQAFSPFYPTAAYTPQTIGGSGYFDGTGDYLSLGGQSAFAFGTGDFTVEFWAYFTSLSVNPTIFDTRPSGTTGGTNVTFYFNPNNTLNYYTNGAIQITSSVISVNTWVHIAVSRSGTSTRMFLNGVQQGATYTDTTNYTVGANRPTIGADGNSTGAAAMTGYLSNIRIIKGTAVYTGNFTPPTAPLTAITNTSLLLNFTNAGIVDSTAKNVLETVGNAQISTTQSKWGGSSMYFDGSGDWLGALNTRTATPSGTESWTIECWIYPTTIDSNFRTIYANEYPIQIYLRNNTIEVYISSAGGSGTYIVSGLTGPAASVSVNTWSHIAFVKNGSDYRVYVNGTGGSTATTATAVAYPTAVNFWIGGFPSTLPQSYAGYINDFRITRGYARYTANFTPPTSALQQQ
jgi:hypothetical protein